MLCSLNPVGHTSFAVFMKTKGENSYEYFKDHLDELEGYIHSVHPNLKDMLRVDPEFMKKMEPTRLVTSKSNPWTIGKCTLVGDAAHAMSPVAGLGGNYGIWDTQIIDDLETELKGNWPKIVEKFEAIQRPNCDAAGEFALAQFYMRVQGFYENEMLLRTMCFDSYLTNQYVDLYISPARAASFLPYTFLQAMGFGKCA